MSARVAITLAELIVRCHHGSVAFSRAMLFRRYHQDTAWLERLDARQGSTDMSFDERAALELIAD